MKKLIGLLMLALCVGCGNPAERQSDDRTLRTIKFELDMIVKPLELRCNGDPKHPDSAHLNHDIAEAAKRPHPYGLFVNMSESPTCYMDRPLDLNGKVDSLYGGDFEALPTFKGRAIIIWG